MHNQERNKKTKLSPLRYSTFIRARRVKHPYNVRTLLLLRSCKIQSKPVSQTWHKSAGHFRLLISLFKLKFHVVQASFFFKFTWLVMLWCCVVRFWNNGKAQWGDVMCWYHIKTHEQFSSDKVTYYVCYRWSEESGTLSDQRWTGREKELEQKKKAQDTKQREQNQQYVKCLCSSYSRLLIVNS